MLRAMEEGARVLYREDAIEQRVRELAAEISRDYAGRDPILVSVLKGGAWFLADLIKATTINCRIDFMAISSYGGAEESMGVVRILQDLDLDIGGHHVIMVEDIVDTGLTLSYLLSTLSSREPASLAVCALLDKSVRRIAPVEIRYRGFDCPDRFVVGYGLDHDERYRNLRCILEVEPEELRRDPLALVPYLDRRG
ncbi:MAG TPA: hypoxanthine phosphoribosyltransferase [Actinomycetota bacterium]